MIPNSRERDFEAKQEAAATNHGDDDQRPRMMLKLPSTRQWSAFRNPRIVRVSRSFGGKDRHSKVCTIRGLRDRRIRLSVPTAIQLYDLQDRLGLSQPSKAVDWLLEAAKEDIEKLPPLQLPQGFGHQYLNHHMVLNNSNFQYPYDSLVMHNSDHQANHNWEVNNLSSLRDHHQRVSDKDVERDSVLLNLDKGKWIIKINDKEERGHDHRHHHNRYDAGQSSNENRSFSSLVNDGNMAFDPSSLSLSSSQFGNHNYLSQQEGSINSYSNGSSTNGMPQFFYGPSSMTMLPLLPTYPPFVANSDSGTVDAHEHLRRLSHFQLLNSTSSQPNLPNSLSLGSAMRPFHQLMNVNPGFGDSQRNQENNRSGDGDSD